MLVGQGRVLIAASEVSEVAYESPATRHGLLTKALLDILMVGEGDVDVLSAASDIMRAVRAESARLGVTQTPVVLGSVQGGLLLPRLRPGRAFHAAFPEYSDVCISSDMQDIVQLGIPKPVADVWSQKYSQGLNALQLEAVNEFRITEGNSLVVVAPTSAGKTFIGEIAAARAITEGRKTVFLLPYRALVNEKFDQFSALYSGVLGLRVIRCSGDYSDEVSSFLKGKYEMALLTYEMFLQLVIGSPAALNQLGLIVLDEAQFITDPTRGMAVELLLTFLLAARERGITPQLIALSAVIGDVNNFPEWLQCRALLSTARPVPLIEGVIDRGGVFQFVDENGHEQEQQLLNPWEIQVRREKPSAQDLLVPLVRKLVNDHEKVIVFRNARGPAQGCANYLAEALGLSPATEALAILPEGDLSGASAALRRALAGGVAFHNSNLTREERIVIEQAFRDPNGPVRVLVATTTVAAGINTPASTVILAENEFIGEDGRAFTVAEYKNMAGRAGRLGFNERGKSIIYAENYLERRNLFQKYVTGTLERLESSFDPREIDTWIVRLLAQVNQIQRSEVPRLLANTYAGYLQNRMNPGWRKQIEHEIADLLDRMISLQLIDVAGDMVSLSLLGRACGRSSLSFASAMRLVDIVKAITPGSLNAVNLIALIQGLPREEMGYTPMMKKGTKESMRVGQASARFGGEIVGVLQRYAYDMYEFYGRCKRAAILFDWISGRRIEEIEAEFTTTPYSGRIEHGDIRRFADTTRFHLRSAADIFLILVPHSSIAQEIDTILTRLEAGLPEGALGLLHSPVPLTRGEYIRIYEAGITTVDDLLGTPESILTTLLGKTRAKSVEEGKSKRR
jgi:replicative superfamily II helicase